MRRIFLNVDFPIRINVPYTSYTDLYLSLQWSIAKTCWNTLQYQILSRIPLVIGCSSLLLLIFYCNLRCSTLRTHDKKNCVEQCLCTTTCCTKLHRCRLPWWQFASTTTRSMCIAHNKKSLASNTPASCLETSVFLLPKIFSFFL